ncbi:MAG: glycoside hydrolase, partial [Eubacterium sp.]|nr:glycoside hydrolase [Eubacterium sp.]
THTGPKARKDGELSVGKLIKENGAYAKINWFKTIRIKDGFFAYSCLTQIDENTIGVMYEAEPSSYLLFETFNIDELIK